MPGGHAAGFIAQETESRGILEQPAIFIERFEGRCIAIAQVDAVLTEVSECSRTNGSGRSIRRAQIFQADFHVKCAGADYSGLLL